MFLYTADGYKNTDVHMENGDILPICDEGMLEWVRKSEVYKLPIWEGDKIFFRLLEEKRDVFSLKLRYEGDRLEEAVLDGKCLKTGWISEQGLN
jgi:8-oxo-dGTP diphosphatase